MTGLRVTGLRVTVAVLAGLLVVLLLAPPAGAGETVGPSAAVGPNRCDDARADAARLYHALFGRDRARGGLAYWASLRWVDGSLTEMTGWVEATLAAPTICAKLDALALTEVRPGLAVGRSGATVTVLADRASVDLSVVNGPRTLASAVAGDVAGEVVVNANWFIGSTPEGPVVADGVLSGTADIIERGQIVVYAAGCDGHGPQDLAHVWMGEPYRHDPCVVAAVSGVSLVHKGVRSDTYPGIDLTTGYTNVARAHSFLGFNETEIIIVSSRAMTSSQLADYALVLGAVEGVMLDGGGSTQIATPTVSLTSNRPVPTFAVLTSRPE